MCAPTLQRSALCHCNMHVNHAMLTRNQMDAMPSQREAQDLRPAPVRLVYFDASLDGLH